MNLADKTQAALDGLGFNPLNAKDWLQAMGPFAMIGVWFIMFAETGLLVGFFLPGDSLLFLAGVASSEVAMEIVGTKISLVGLLIGAPICAIVGAQLGHHLGAKYGTRLFENQKSRLFQKLFKPEYIDKAEHYFTKFGPAKAVVLARFIPIVRTVLNPVAGMLGMPAKTFLLWNVIGGILWTDGIILVGHFLAKQILDSIGVENIDKYILPVVMLIVLISMLPIFIEVFRNLRERKRAKTNIG
ncbi:DedA family protein [Longispora sp. NPDC051575]|uniref:DedA family protein n=1 Tax=Longispora sp. NPDC051575 TaxID=3154943 RepID=UPI0034310B0F